MNRGVTPTTIASGASLSGLVTVRSGEAIFGIMMPADWTAADLTFQAGVTSDTLFDVYDEFDAEVTVQAGADRFIILEPARWLGVSYLKIRSGTSGSAVAQAAARILQVVTVET